jgi:hypothetical protein
MKEFQLSSDPINLALENSMAIYYSHYDSFPLFGFCKFDGEKQLPVVLFQAISDNLREVLRNAKYIG